jgi:hypothetical protein
MSKRLVIDVLYDPQDDSYPLAEPDRTKEVLMEIATSLGWFGTAEITEVDEQRWGDLKTGEKA